MLICGQEFNFSALNAKDIERMDTAQQHMTAASAAEAKREKTGYADALRGQCRLVMEYLDELLGEGAAARLGLDGSDFNDCIRVTEEFKQAIQAEQNRAYRPGVAPKKAVAYPAAAKTAAQADKETRRKQLLRELAELEND
jgi:hypothetical protein